MFTVSVVSSKVNYTEVVGKCKCVHSFSCYGVMFLSQRSWEVGWRF